MKRFPDWEQRLHRFCSSRMRAPFVWGQHDCALFVADAVEQITGFDLASECRNRYDSKESAMALLQELSGGGLEEYAAQVAQQNGMQEVGIKFAQRGDMVLAIENGWPSLGIVSLDGMRSLFAVEGAATLERVAVLQCKRAWRVG
jgi:hypothetical protein